MLYNNLYVYLCNIVYARATIGKLIFIFWISYFSALIKLLKLVPRRDEET